MAKPSVSKSTTQTESAVEEFGQIQRLSNQSTTNNIGIFNQPTSFDSTAYAAKWVKIGDVDKATQDEYLQGTSFKAPGWRVWHCPLTQESKEVSASDGKYVLMYRPQSIQSEVNRLLGNVGRKHLQMHLSGEAAGSQSIEGSGLLSHQQLRPSTGDEGVIPEQDAKQFSLTPEPDHRVIQPARELS